MKVGDMVRCTWQPRTSFVKEVGGEQFCVPMTRIIEGELGIIVEVEDNGFHWRIAFPSHGGYTHTLSSGAFEAVNVSRS